MMTRFNRAMLVLLLAVGIPYYWFVLDTSTPSAKPQPITIAQLRNLATAPGELAPIRIRFERIASQSLMGNRIAAGMGLRSIRLHTISYMVEYDDRAPVMIGAGMTRTDAKRFEHVTFGTRAQARVTRALTKARTLVPLSPAPEQMGGMRMIGETEQARTLDAKLARQQQADRIGVPHRVAPGVVVIPTLALESGSRLVYVRLASGREYLFLGNLAPTRLNWFGPRLPARFVTDLGRLEDREALYSWLLTVRELKENAPALVVVPGGGIPKKSGLLHYFDESANIVT